MRLGRCDSTCSPVSRTMLCMPSRGGTRGRHYPKSALIREWDVDPDLEPALCREGTGQMCVKADAIWGPLRPEEIPWRWKGVFPDAHDFFAVSTLEPSSEEAPLSMWCSTSPRVLQLPGGVSYRLDFFEVHPSARGSFVAAFTVALIARRALECGASRVVLAAVPESRKIYDRTGAKQKLVKGWKNAPGLLPFVYEDAALRQLSKTLEHHD